MNRLNRINLFFALLVWGFAAVSCTTDDENGGPRYMWEGETAEISILVDLPQATSATTRSLGSATENKIEDIQVLAFDKLTGDLITKARGKSLAPVSGMTNKVTFKATLPVGDEYNFIVLANTGTLLSGIDVGYSPAKKRSDMLALTVSSNLKWDPAASIPMWSESDLTLTASSSPTFEMTRMLARVNVEVALNEISPGVTRDNFRLTSVRYYNYNTAGAPVPADGSFDFTTYKALQPTIPLNPGNQQGSALLYDGSDIAGNISCREKIYVFEAAHNGSTYSQPGGNSDWINNPCLVIGGEFKTEDGTWLEESYYRVDFIRKDLTNPDDPKDVWLPVLRNFSYNVAITEVGGSGYPDHEIALRSAPINMEANVLDWNDRGMGNIVFDGVFYLSVSRDEFTVSRAAVSDEKEENVLYVKTDYTYDNNPSHSKSGWKVEKYVDADDPQTEVSWLRLNPAQGSPDDLVKAYFTYDENTSTNNRTAIVWIAAGRLRYPVYVTQKILEIDITDPDDNDAPLSELRFVVPVEGSLAKTRKFEVKWLPESFPVSIDYSSPQTFNQFQPEWLNPNPNGMSWSIPGGSGSQVFEVRAPSVDLDDLKIDPFYEKESTYTFTVNNLGDSESRSITLHQIHYNIVVDTYSYWLDGSTQTLTVRSNTEWEIAKIEEWLYNRDPEIEKPSSPVMLQLNNYDNLRVNTTGGPNTAGEAVGFTVVNQDEDAHRNKWGTIYVTFVSPTGKFEPQRIPLSFPPRSMTLLGLGDARNVRGHNVAFSPTYHLNGAHTMLSSELNFGQLPESVVKVNDFRIVGYHCLGGIYPANPSEPGSNWYRGGLRDYLNRHNPDILVLTYGIQFTNAYEDEELAVIKRFLDNDGAVILYYNAPAYPADLARTLGTLFGKTFSSSGSSPDVMRWAANPTTGGVHPVQDGPEWEGDPILDGPFGRLLGKNWGAYYYFGGIKASAIENEAYIYSYSQDRYTASSLPGYQLPSGYATSFRHKELNLVGFLCSGFVASYYNSINETDPFKLKADFSPDERTLFGYGDVYFPKNQTVDNATFFANTVAWAMSVTNHKMPVGGY